MHFIEYFVAYIDFMTPAHFSQIIFFTLAIPKVYFTNNSPQIGCFFNPKPTKKVAVMITKLPTTASAQKTRNFTLSCTPKFLQTTLLSALFFLLLGVGESWGQCTTGTQYPPTTFTPTTTWSNISTACYSNEYSVISVTCGSVYSFRSYLTSNNATARYTTVTNADASLVLTHGSTSNTVSLTWTSNYTGTVRMYTHKDATCAGTNTNSQTRQAMVVNGSVPAQPSTITGSTSFCASTSQTYSVTNVSGVTYTWSYSGTGTITGSGNSVSLNASTGGTLTVTPSNCVGNGTARTITLTVNSIPACVSSAAPSGSGQSAAGVTLSWGAVSGATSYDVYFGTDGSGATTPTNILNASNQATTTFSTGALSGSTTYYYKIVPKNSCGSASSCSIYSFTTAAACTAPTFTATPTNPLCNSGTGSISVSASSGTSPYQYSKDNGVTWQESSTFSGLATGTYVIVVKGNDGCTAAGSSIMVSNPTALTASVTSATLSGCSGSTVSLGGSATGGTGTLVYSWSPTTGLSNATVASPTLTISSAQTYTLSVTDSNGCASNQPTVAVSIGGITKYWAGAGSGMTGATTGTDFNTAANWSSTTGTKTAVSTEPQSCDNAVISLTSAATITLSANATVNSLDFKTIFNGAGAILDIQTYLLTTIANYSINMATGAGSSSTIEQRIGNGGILTVGGNANIGTGPVVSGFVDVRGSGLTTTTGTIVFRGDLTFGDGYGSIDNTSFIGDVYFDAISSQNITIAPNYACGFKSNKVILGLTNLPTVNLFISSSVKSFLLSGNTPELKINSNCTLNMNAVGIAKSTTWAAGGTINLQANSILKLSGASGGQTGSNFPTNFTTYTFNPTSTVEYYGATQTVFATPTYGNLTITTSGTKTAGGALTVAGNLLINSPATFAAGTSLTHNLAGNYTNNGTFSFTTANTMNFNGAALQTISGTSSTGFSTLIVNKGTSVATILDITGAGAVTASTLTLTNGLLRVSTGGNFNSNNTLTIGSTSGIEVNGGTYSSNGSVTNSGLFKLTSGTANMGSTASHTFSNAASSTFTMLAGAMNVSSRMDFTGANTAGTFSGGTLTLNTVGNSSTTIPSLDIQGAASITMSSTASLVFQLANTSTGGDLKITSGAGTKSFLGGTVQFGNTSTAASSTFSCNSGVTLNNVTINSTNTPAVKLVTNNLTVAGTLTMNGGNIDGATNSLTTIVTNNSTTAIVRTAGYVNYKLKRAVTTIGADYLWPVGFSTNYTPATYNFTNLTSGDLEVLAVGGQEPNLASSSIDNTKDVGMYWTTTPTSAVSTDYSGNYAWPSGLNVGTVSASSFIFGKYNVGTSAWAYPTISGTPTATTLAFTGANGLITNHAIGNCRPPTTASNSSTQSICTATTSITNLGGNNPTVGVGTWSVVSGPSTLSTQFGDVNTYNTSFTPAGGAGSYVIRWTIDLASPGACSSPSSADATITVNPTSVGGTIAGSDTVCSGTNSTTLTLSGYTGTVTSWESSLDNFVTAGTTIANTTTTLLASNLNATTSYRAVVTSGVCSAVNSATATVTVNTRPNSPTALSYNCSGSAELTATAGSGETVAWYETNSQSASPVLGQANSANTATLTIASPTAGSYYAFAMVNGCKSAEGTQTPVETSPVNKYTGGANGTSTDWFTDSNWTCGVPTASTNAMIPSGKTVVITTSDAQANKLTVNGSLTLGSTTINKSITVTNEVIVSGGSFVVNSGSNLVQTSPSAVNTGNIQVKRATRALKLYDGVLWSSPVTGQVVNDLASGMNPNYIKEYNISSNAWNVLTTATTATFPKGKAYLMRTPSTGFSLTTATPWNVTFTGVPNNGNITVTGVDTTIPAGTEQYYLVGNPYPSAINLNKFMDSNPNVTGVFYFFRKTDNAPYSAYGVLTKTQTSTSQGIGTYTNTFNLNHPSEGATDPTDVIPVGQGFFVTMRSGHTGEVYFNNGMRIANNSASFNRLQTNTEDKFKLNLTTTSNAANFSQMNLGYAEGSSSSYDVGYDAESFNDGRTNLSSMIASTPYSIQSRGTYAVTDFVPLYFKTNVNGEHRIKLQDAQGVFAADQMVILKDNLTGTQHNLTANGDYVFTSATGVFTNRFEVVYQQAYYTALQTVSCGSTLSTMSSLVYADIVNGATGYRFKVVNNTTSAVQTIDRPYHWFALNMLSSYDYNTAYTISVQVQKDGVWTGYYGTSCTVNSPNIASTGIMQINPSQCGVTLPTLGTVIATTPVANATGYKFRITNTTAGASGANLVQEITRTNHWFTLAMLTRYNYGSSYAIEVAVKTTGGYTPYGNACTVYSPAVPTLATCGQAVATSTTLVRTTAMTLATQYRFQVTRVATQETITFDTANYWFSFRVNVPGYAAGEQYGVRVAVMTAGAWSPYGDACDITAPFATARTTEEAAPSEAGLFKPVAYPNPFKSEFTVALATPFADDVTLVVYDLQGRLIEKQTVPVSKLDTIHIGANYQMGDYMLVVSQGPAIESMLLHKE